MLDIGCGRGEFLDLMKEAGIPARGIDLDAESVALCRSKGHEAETADLFVYLSDQADGTFDGIFAAQVVEHLPPERLPHMIEFARRSSERGAARAGDAKSRVSRHLRDAFLSGPDPHAPDSAFADGLLL